MSKPLSWKPVRNGARYCAPACGRGCRHEDYLDAKRRAKKLAQRMGPGWKPHVWENLGWHYSVISPCKRIKLHPSYTAFLGEPDCAGGRWVEHANTPEKAVLRVINTAKADLKRFGAFLKGL